jgi:hypothetical protein
MRLQRAKKRGEFFQFTEYESQLKEGAERYLARRLEAPQTSKTYAGTLRKLCLRDVQCQSAGLRPDGKLALGIGWCLECRMDIYFILQVLIFEQ